MIKLGYFVCLFQEKNILENGFSFPLSKGSYTKLQTLTDKFCYFLFYQKNKHLFIICIILWAQIKNVKLVINQHFQLTYRIIVSEITRNGQNLLSEITRLLHFVIGAFVIAPVVKCTVLASTLVIDIKYFVNFLFNINIR